MTPPPAGQFVTVNSLVVRGLRDPKGGTSLGLRRGGGGVTFFKGSKGGVKKICKPK